GSPSPRSRCALASLRAWWRNTSAVRCAIAATACGGTTSRSPTRKNKIPVALQSGILHFVLVDAGGVSPPPHCFRLPDVRSTRKPRAEYAAERRGHRLARSPVVGA